MSSLDFSHFKKTGQDKKCATLMHPDGHEIKIAISGLSPALKKQLEALPLHQAEGSRNPIAPMDDASPAVADDPVMEEPAVEQGAMEEVAATPPQAAPVAPAPVATPQAPAPVAAAPAVAPVAPEQAPAPVEQEAAPEPTVEELAAQRDKQDLDFANDLHAGHIKPETYRSLFDKKDTLGKIGTLFGLMVSGAGAGLTHQPNALMALMDKQIQNDLEAQKTNQSNKQSWYKLSIEHARAQIENDLKSSETTKNLTENEMSAFVNSKAGVVESIGTYNAKNKALAAGIQVQQDLINKMPPGPQRDNSQNNLNSLVIPATLKQIQENNQKAAGLEMQIKQDAKEVASSEEGESGQGPINQKAYQSMITTGELLSKKGYVDPSKGIDPKDNADIKDAITGSQTNWKNYHDVMEAANALAKMPLSGQTPAGVFRDAVKKIPWAGEALAGGVNLVKGNVERPRDILVNALTQRLSAHGASHETINEIRDSLTPNMFDNPKTLKSLEETIYQHFAHNDKEQSGVFTKYPKIKKQLPKIKLSSGEQKKEEASTEKESPKPKEEKSKDGLVNTLKQMFTVPSK